MSHFPKAIDPRDILTDYRASIDNIDAALIHMLAERFRCTKAVGVLKAEHGLPPADLNREAEQIARLRRLAKDAHLDPDFAEKFLNFVVREVIRHHEQIAASTGAADDAASPHAATAAPGFRGGEGIPAAGGGLDRT